MHSISSQEVGSCYARGADIHQAAKEGNVDAVRHFLHVDPGSLESQDFKGRSLGTDVGSCREDVLAGVSKILMGHHVFELG